MPVSIRRSLLVGVAVVQIVAATAATVLVVRHERRQSYAVLEANLSEHAALVKSAIEPPDEGREVAVLHREQLMLARGERYVLRDAAGRVVAASSNWLADGPLPPGERTFADIRIEGRAYRALVLRNLALLNVEPDEVKNLPNLTLVYAGRVGGVEEHIQQVAWMAPGTCAVMLIISLLATSWVVTTGLRPVVQIVDRAARIDASHWELEESSEGAEAKELAPLSVALTHLVQRLRASFERERRFSADAAHEMKTAVAIVKSTLQLGLDRERAAAEYRLGMERALEDTERLQRLVQDMLQLAKIESQGAASRNGTSESSRAEVEEELRTVQRQLAPLMDRRGISLRVESDGAVGAVRIGSDELRVVLTNLLENAIQASEDGSLIKVKVDKIAQDCLISVADHGCGISPEALPHIFERFFRSDPSRSRESGGNGLGLAITQAIVQRAGGSIEASSELGRGSVFVVRLPGVV